MTENPAAAAAPERPGDAGPPCVSESEFALLSVARAVVDQAPGRDLGPVAAYLHQALRVPAHPRGKLGPAAVDLLEHTLSVGLVLTLMRRGGWQTARCVDAAGGAGARPARLWERHQPPALEVSKFGVRLLLWLTAAPLRRSDCEPLSEVPQTLGDHLLAYAALDLTRRASCEAEPAKQPAFRLSPLCWLGFADVLSAPAEPPRDLSFAALVGKAPGGDGQIVLEALQPDLARRWTEMERAKRHVRDPDRMRRLGASQELVLDRLLSACDQAQRRDLAGFALAAAAQVLADRPGPAHWIAGLNARGPGGGAIAVRAESRRMASAFLRGLATIERWRQEAASARFFDDDYDAAQLLLSMWEPLGDAGYAHAQAIAARLESLDAAVDTGDVP